jgi:hypothetical protein
MSSIRLQAVCVEAAVPTPQWPDEEGPREGAGDE